MEFNVSSTHKELQVLQAADYSYPGVDSPIPGQGAFPTQQQYIL